MSFRLKTVLGIALIELTVMGILIGINQFALGGSAADQLYQRAEATARVFANAVSDAVIATDLATLDATIETALSTEELSYLRVRNPTGLVLSEGGDALALAAEFAADASFDTARNDHRIDLDVPITVEGLDYGRIEMGLSTASVEREIAMALAWNLAVAFIGMSLVAIFGYVLGSYLTHQLHWLREGARGFAAGDLDRKIRVRGTDELAETAQCFNDMANSLAQDRATLAEQRNQLLAKKARVEVIVNCMTMISRGEDEISVPDTDRDDEIGSMARATVIFQESMRATEEAQQEQKRLVTAFDQIAEQVVVFDETGHAIFLNAAFRRFNRDILAELPHSFTQKEFLRMGYHLGAFPGVSGDPEDWIEAQLARENMAPEEIRRAPDRVTLTVQTYVDGIGVVLTAKDVTELRISEQQLIQASKMATLGEMATGIAHELNQPLGVIRMASSNCVKRIQKGIVDPDYLMGKLQRMGEQTERASQIINHMRVFGRKAVGVMEPFDLREALLETATLARTQLKTLDISLKVAVPETPAYVMGERVIFEQVLLNLVSNARDAIEEHGDGGPGEIRFEADFDGPDGHAVHVYDSGGGIPETVLDKLFEPFFTTKEPGKGTGLGLSISFGTIRDMSGRISARNVEGGACFTITLPDVGAAVSEAS
ncbi:Sensory box histidine kinase [Candidatus Rhodobacter oscarellae]|uniref:histidine kinase n=1 Tax=Candidatus Rhodobacter oscarellae TaxID=1675527 RepID=A0A0J9E8S9_9RHOB|nr:ATP-binding protein [Candidatus Rhodobacter lobularis]KMW59180.1 Sensory box histidine kinase [Candidatus Rhodobacter lobularis]